MDAYKLNGYSDWFLPSQDELNTLYQQKDIVGGFVNSLYWSSSEINNLTAVATDFNDGTQSNIDKGVALEFRAVRVF